jgi:hypothetical protein
MTRRNKYLFSKLLALLLMGSLLLAQWSGLQHRVAHAWLLPADIVHSESERSDQETPDKSFSHSCALLDAATVGACLASAKYVPPLLSSLSLPISVLPMASWQALFTPQFSSRAPPF